MGRKKKDKKVYIEMSQILSKTDESPISDRDYDKFVAEYCKMVEKLGFQTGGGFSLLSEKQVLEL